MDRPIRPATWTPAALPGLAVWCQGVPGVGWVNMLTGEVLIPAADLPAFIRPREADADTPHVVTG